MDFLALGDTAIDTFIRLIEAEAHCDVNSEKCTLTMRFGDKIPFESATVVAAVGNAANAAVSAARLGLSSQYIAWVGKDRDGEDCLTQLAKEHIESTYVKVQEGKMTNSHYVLWYGPERTILIKHENFDSVFPKDVPVPKAFYLSSLGEHGLHLHDDIADWLIQNPKVLFAFQPGTFQIKAGLKRLERIYLRTDIFFANKEEYQRILNTAEADPKKLMELMQQKGPRICFLTNGAEGAYVLSHEGMWFIGLYPDPRPAFERTGAGDAFASTATVALLLGKSVPEALTWGPVNSMSVVQDIGAQRGLLSREKIEELLLKAPDFTPQKLA